MIERELQIKPGDLLTSRPKSIAGAGLLPGLFRRTITELAHGDEGKRDVLVTVEELPTTVVYGAGAEDGSDTFGRLKTEVWPRVV
jgi:hypothetical protein